MLIAAELFTTFISVLNCTCITSQIERTAKNESLSGERMGEFGESRGGESVCFKVNIRLILVC